MIFNLKNIVKKAANDEIENIIVLTPSLYEFTFHPFKMLETIHTFLYAAKTFLTKDSNSYRTYRRRRGYFTKMFSDDYRVDKYLSFKYPYGRIHLYGLKLRWCVFATRQNCKLMLISLSKYSMTNLVKWDAQTNFGKLKLFAYIDRYNLLVWGATSLWMNLKFY